ncbi:hypothetical protein GCM10029992_46260 [Glycomyces albus]
MPQRRVTVGSKVGLHARPAALFVQAAAAQDVPVTIGKDGVEPVDARSILSVIGLDAKGARRSSSTPRARAPKRPSTRSRPSSKPTTTQRSSRHDR